MFVLEMKSFGGYRMKKGERVSEEVRNKMSESARARCTPEWRAKMSEMAKKRIADGAFVQLPPVMRGADNPNFGKSPSEETRARMSAAQRKRAHPKHTDAERQKISEGNVRAILTGTRKYRFHVASPCGGTVPCRSRREEALAQHLCTTQGVLSVVGEDRMDPIVYALQGRQHLTVGDFIVTRSDGVKVMVEGKSETSFYKEKDRARIEALWKWAVDCGMPLIIAINSKPMPSVWEGPFVTEAFMEGIRNKRVRYRTMKVVPLEAVAPSVCL